MISMKNKATKANVLSPGLDSPSSEPYPYGLRLTLNEDSLAKLGITDLPAVGTAMVLTAKVTVSSASESEHEGEKKHRDISLQITDMDLGAKPKGLYA